MALPEENPIGFLLETCQKHATVPLPQFIDCGSSGPDHCKRFYVRCIYAGHEVVACSHQKKQVKNKAAKRMIDLLKKNDHVSKLSVTELNNERSIENYHRAPNMYHVYHFTGKNPISALHEYCQKKRLHLPVYKECPTTGIFLCQCTVNNIQTYGQGTNKKTAKTDSSLKMCRQLNITFVGQEFCETELRKLEECFDEKNAISVLQEFCKRKSLPDPVYENKPPFMNFFVVVCSVGYISGEGKDITKTGAKLFAASKVLMKLAKNKDALNKAAQSRSGIKSAQQTADGSIMYDLCSGIGEMSIQENQKPNSLNFTEDFILGSDSEDDNVETPSHLHNCKVLKSLTHNDSVVEVDVIHRFRLKRPGIADI